MEFDLRVTTVVFAAIVAIGVGGLIAAPFMTASTVLMMVAPSMIAFGLICLGLGMKYGEHRAGSAR
jgi:hypothetical protein